jgi:hypothetical protein
LGRDFVVLVTFGHVRDLPRSRPDSRRR